ncbi:MAG: cytochrome P460 family protein [Planctomycetia bacterium]|nr:cytochrome P460 family protein [Planctomycetia bacterium]
MRGLERTWVRDVLCVFLVVPVVASTAWAQGSGSSRATPSPPRQPTTEEFAASLWKYLHREQAPYAEWQAAEIAAPQSVQDPHGSNGKVYLNDVAAKDTERFAYSSIVVREDYVDNADRPQSISVMYRVRGADPKSGDWYWLKYTPDGKLARSATAGGGRPIAGRVASCIECHQKAVGKDLVFFNDAVPQK